MTIPTPQEVQRLIADLRPLSLGNINTGGIVEQAAAALSAYQQEVATLRERVAPLDEGPVCLLADYQAMRDRAEAAEARVRELEQERDAFWQMVTAGWDIEDRAYFESKARAMGYGSPEAMAAHHVWKRDPRVEQARHSAFAEAMQMALQEPITRHRSDTPRRMRAAIAKKLAANAVENSTAALLAKATPPIHTEEPTNE
jgi:hypothetical protein